MEPGALVTLDIEKPAVGGRMLARVNGQVVLVWGAIPGERVRARIERIGRGVVYAETAEVLDASPDRREAGPDWRCGGNVYAHVTYDRQVRMKGEIIRETLGRIGRLPLAEPPIVLASPERGYRMRARLHIGNGRLGYFREGTHELCDPAITGQLLPSTLAWIADAERYIENERVKGLISVEFIENMRGDQRACHVECEPGTKTPETELLAGNRWVSDMLHARNGNSGSVVHVRRSPRAFFQANRFLLERLVQHVVSLVPDGPVIDLYAGVGLFGLALAAAGTHDVTLVEGDPAGEADLRANALPFGSRVRVERRSVETFLAHPLNGLDSAACTFIVDPPRTGMSRGAMAGIVHARPARIVYVSCDIATLARDTRTLLDAGYSLEGLTGLDLFPNTAHVESVAQFVYR